LHDGGVNVELLVDGQVACDSGATYGGSPEFFNKNPMGHPDSATEHISKMTICQGDTFKYKELKPGQKWVLKAYYDYSKFKGVSSA
jgi:hypothetical protein